MMQDEYSTIRTAVHLHLPVREDPSPPLLHQHPHQPQPLNPFPRSKRRYYISTLDFHTPPIPPLRVNPATKHPSSPRKLIAILKKNLNFKFLFSVEGSVLLALFEEEELLQSSPF